MRITSTQPLPELRCQHCGKKLAEGYVDLLIIKCLRCRTYNTLREDCPKCEADSLQRATQHH